MRLPADSATPFAIRASGLEKIYSGGVAGLRALSCEVCHGEMVGLLGPSGSGKTTLFRLLGGALRPTGGTLEVLGHDMRGIVAPELQALRRQIGTVSQQHNLVPRLSAAQNVLIGRLGRRPAWSALRGLVWLRDGERRAAFDALNELGLAERLYARVDDLSGGQQQRVAVARAMLDRPELLLADEPIASVDGETASVIMERLQRLNAERGTTVLVSLHQRDFAYRFCSRVIELAAGTVVYDGPPRGSEAGEFASESPAGSPARLATLER